MSKGRRNTMLRSFTTVLRLRREGGMIATAEFFRYLAHFECTAVVSIRRQKTEAGIKIHSSTAAATTWERGQAGSIYLLAPIRLWSFI